MKSPARQDRRPRAHQQGAVLVVALVILTIVTLLGISTMSTTQVETAVSANSASSNRLRQAADSLAIQLLNPPPSNANPVHLLTVGASLESGDWQSINPAKADANWPLPENCGSARWRSRQLYPLPNTTGNLDGYSYFELEVECYQFPGEIQLGGANDGDRVADLGAFSRVVAGMRVINPQQN